MKEFFPTLHAAALFSRYFRRRACHHASPASGQGSTPFQRPACFAPERRWRRWALYWRAAPPLMQEDIWGNRNILSKTGPGQTFADVFACAPGSGAERERGGGEHDDGDVSTHKARFERAPPPAPTIAYFIRNLLGELAEKNLRLNEKLTHMGQRTTRAKLMSYFPLRHCDAGSMSSTFRFSQQLGGLPRCGAQRAVRGAWKMRDEGLLYFHKSHFLSKRRSLTVPFLLRVKGAPFGRISKCG